MGPQIIGPQSPWMYSYSMKYCSCYACIPRVRWYRYQTYHSSILTTTIIFHIVLARLALTLVSGSLCFLACEHCLFGAYFLPFGLLLPFSNMLEILSSFGLRLRSIHPKINTIDCTRSAIENYLWFAKFVSIIAKWIWILEILYLHRHCSLR